MSAQPSTAPTSDTRRQLIEVIAIERAALQALEGCVSDSAVEAVDLLAQCRGHVVVTGIGKSGLIGQKLTATLSSTGTPALFVHPVEARHGDLGSVTANDVLMALSFSGETTEVIELVSDVRRMNLPVIAMTGFRESTLARISNIVVEVAVEREADPFQCVPSASTTALLAMGDALALAAMQSRGFTKDRFAALHPGGSLGRKLLWRVAELMHTGTHIPLVPGSCTVSTAMLEMTKKRLGATFVVDHNGAFVGIFTDGDLRRLLQRTPNPLELTVNDVMTSPARTIAADRLASEALELMEEYAITVLPVVDVGQVPVGALHLHDLVQAGFR